jgi:hypothetical protein
LLGVILLAMVAACVMRVAMRERRDDERAEVMRRSTPPVHWSVVFGALEPGRIYTIRVLEETGTYPRQRWQEVADLLMTAEDTDLDRELRELQS